MEGVKSQKGKKGKCETADKAADPMDQSLLTDIRNLILSARAKWRKRSMPGSLRFTGRLDGVSARIFSKKSGRPTARRLSLHCRDN